MTSDTERRESPLSGHNDCLTHCLISHCCIRILGDGKQVRFKFSSTSTMVRLNNLRAVEGNTLERIYGNENDSTVCVDAVLSITISDRVKNCFPVVLVRQLTNSIGTDLMAG
jgi:hypothetical protein